MKKIRIIILDLYQNFSCSFTKNLVENDESIKRISTANLEIKEIEIPKTGAFLHHWLLDQILMETLSKINDNFEKNRILTSEIEINEKIHNQEKKFLQNAKDSTIVQRKKQENLNLAKNQFALVEQTLKQNGFTFEMIRKPIN